MPIDFAAESALMRKSIEAVKAILKAIVANNYHWSSERVTLKRSSSKYEINIVMLLASRVDALAQRLDRIGTSPILDSS